MSVFNRPLFHSALLAVLCWQCTGAGKDGRFDQLKSAVLPPAVGSLNCLELLSSYQTLECPYTAAAHAEGQIGPPKEMPVDLEEAYTLNGAVPTAKFFVDDTNNSHVSMSKQHQHWHPTQSLKSLKSLKSVTSLSVLSLTDHNFACFTFGRQGTFYRFSAQLIEQYIKSATLNQVRNAPSTRQCL